MAVLSKTGITTGATIQVGHVTQSVDAFTGLVSYDITLSGSLTSLSIGKGGGGVDTKLLVIFKVTWNVELS